MQSLFLKTASDRLSLSAASPLAITLFLKSVIPLSPLSSVWNQFVHYHLFLQSVSPLSPLWNQLVHCHFSLSDGSVSPLSSHSFWNQSTHDHLCLSEISPRSPLSFWNQLVHHHLSLCETSPQAVTSPLCSQGESTCQQKTRGRKKAAPLPEAMLLLTCSSLSVCHWLGHCMVQD